MIMILYYMSVVVKYISGVPVIITIYILNMELNGISKSSGME